MKIYKLTEVSSEIGIFTSENQKAERWGTSNTNKVNALQHDISSHVVIWYYI